MKAKIERHIPAAIRQIDAYFKQLDNKPISKEFKGYLSSLGASVIMSGLLPTLAVYYSKESKADRGKVIGWVYEIVKSQPKFNACNNNEDLFKYALEIQGNPQMLNALTEEILNISVALKLSIRTFPLK